MAGSIAVTTHDLGAGVTEYRVVWTSDASGNVSGNVFEMMPGTIISVEFVPGSGGTQPTDLYDIDADDAQGVSIFDNGAGTTIGANLSNAVASHALPLLGLAGTTAVRRWHQGGTVEVSVTNAGDAKTGTVSIFVVAGVI